MNPGLSGMCSPEFEIFAMPNFSAAAATAILQMCGSSSRAACAGTEDTKKSVL